MKINGEEVQLKITPLALRKIEESDSEFDFLKLLREAQEGTGEPKITDYYKIIYVGYIGAQPDSNITFDDFLKLIEDIDLIEINHVGVKLLLERKN